MAIAKRPLPNIKGAQASARLEANPNEHTVLCIDCGKPLWRILLKGRYGTKYAADKIPFPGVPPYEEYWDKTGLKPLRVDCPFCGEPYFKAIKGPQGSLFPKFRVKEHEI
jgi:hypothetical protein